jgi:lipopolysaccharide export system permease protein
MKILDKYILSNFLKTYVFVVFLIVLIICVIDYTEKVDNFIEKAISKKEIFLDYYFNLAPYWANYVSPLMIFIATVFLTSRMAARTEIIAILGSGVSFRRFLLPYVMGSVLVACVTFAMVGWFIPMANKTRIAFEQKYIKGTYYFDGRNVHLKVGPQSYAYIESYNNPTKTGYRFTLEKIEGTKLVEKLSADRITWDSTLHKWKMYDYFVRKLEPSQVLTKGVVKDTTLAMYPQDFESDYMLYETFTLTELQNFIKLQTARDADGMAIYFIERHIRFSNPIAVIILTLMGVILSARKSRGGVGFQVALGFALAFVYIMFFLMTKGLAESGKLPIMLAVWLPNLVFGAITTFLYYTVPR